MRVIAIVSAKTPALAFASASRAIDIHRALWCLFSNSHMELFVRSWNPINLIRLGSVHTVHEPNGSPAGGTSWFEPHHLATEVFKPTQAVQIRNRVTGILLRIKNCPYRQDIITALLLYVRALDEINQNTAFIRLWTAVERLASPGHGDYDAIVRRCSFLWDDVPFATQTLEHLREYRNQSMHAGIESAQAKTYCYQLQQQFRTLLLFYIGNVRRFGSLKEANDFLDLPSDSAALGHLAKVVAHAKRFRKS